MLPIINIFGYEIATYGLIIFIGIFVGSTVAVLYYSKFQDVSKEDIIFAILFGVIGMGIGGKILYLITCIPFLVENYANLDFSETILQLFKGGFVFYGGLIGGILGIYIYAKQFKIDFKKLILVIIPVVPLVHAFGRIGCFFAGCCYGIEYHGIGNITFHNTIFAPNNIPLFPVQIVEAISNLIIFVILMITYKKYQGTQKTVTLYCILYSILRFILEFLRGDAARGVILNLSTSQWISIFLFIVAICINIYYSKKRRLEKSIK